MLELERVRVAHGLVDRPAAQPLRGERARAGPPQRVVGEDVERDPPVLTAVRADRAQPLVGRPERRVTPRGVRRAQRHGGHHDEADRGDERDGPDTARQAEVAHAQPALALDPAGIGLHSGRDDDHPQQRDEDGRALRLARPERTAERADAGATPAATAPASRPRRRSRCRAAGSTSGRGAAAPPGPPPSPRARLARTSGRRR